MSAQIKYFLVLAANMKVAHLETKIQEIKKEKKEQNQGEFLFTTILFSKSVKVAQFNYQSCGWQIEFQRCQIDKKRSASFQPKNRWVFQIEA